MMTEQELRRDIDQIYKLKAQIEKLSKKILNECKRVGDVLGMCFDGKKPYNYYFTGAEEGEVGMPDIHGIKTTQIVCGKRDHTFIVRKYLLNFYLYRAQRLEKGFWQRLKRMQMTLLCGPSKLKSWQSRLVRS